MSTNTDSALDTIVKHEINKIASLPAYTVFYDLSVKIHTPKGDLDTLYAVRFDRLKDFISNFADVINVSVAMPMGMYQHDVVPYKDKIEVTVALKPLMSTTEYNRYRSGEIINQRFTARLVDQQSPLVEGQSDAISNKGVADRDIINVVTFQLIDAVNMALRTKTVGFIARDTAPMDVIKYCLTEYSKDLNSGDAEQIEGVNIVPGYTQEVREHIPIPHLTRLTKLPWLVNQIVGGMYPTGFSYYLKDKWWYVFPLYNTKRFGSSDFTLTIINIPPNRMPGSEKTFRVTPTQVIVISTGKVKYVDSSLSETDSLGNVARFIDANKVVGDFGKVEDNKFITNFGSNVVEAAIDTGPELPKQEIHHETKITSSYNLEYSKLAERQGSKIIITWENSNDAVLYPGMPVRYMFLVNGVTHQLYGTLLASETMMVPINQNPKLKKFGATTSLSCFMSRDITNQDVE